MLADGNGDFAKAVGLTMDGSKFGMGTRSQRYSMLIEDGVVKQLNVEAPGEFKAARPRLSARPALNETTDATGAVAPAASGSRGSFAFFATRRPPACNLVAVRRVGASRSVDAGQRG